MSALSFGTFYLRDRVARWRAGDRAAADELLQAVGERLQRMAHVMLRQFPAVRGLAETGDVVQEACLRLLTTLRSVEPNSTTHFFRLASLQIRRELLDLARGRVRRRTVGLEQAAEVVDQRSSETEDLERWQRFHEEVEKLPEDEREVFGLLFYLDWKQEEAAEHLGVDVRTVRRRRDRADARLYTALGGKLPATGK
jgi:RNA polymerase sigma-70 factor (ECF subfamily)